MNAPVLRVEDLSVAFHTRGGVVRALDRVGFSVASGQTMALVGEVRFLGKSVTACAIMGLLEEARRNHLAAARSWAIPIWFKRPRRRWRAFADGASR